MSEFGFGFGFDPFAPSIIPPLPAPIGGGPRWWEFLEPIIPTVLERFLPMKRFPPTLPVPGGVRLPERIPPGRGPARFPGRVGGVRYPRSAKALAAAAAAAAALGISLEAYLAMRGKRGRRMNVANVKALRRSMRRVQGFEKLARRTISFTHRVKMKKSSRRK